MVVCALFNLSCCSAQEGEDVPSKGVGPGAITEHKGASKRRKGGGISKSKSVELDANSMADEDTAPLLLN